MCAASTPTVLSVHPTHHKEAHAHAHKNTHTHTLAVAVFCTRHPLLCFSSFLFFFIISSPPPLLSHKGFLEDLFAFSKQRVLFVFFQCIFVLKLEKVERETSGKSNKSSIIGRLPPTLPLPLTHTTKQKGEWQPSEHLRVRVYTHSSFKANICPPPPTLTNTDVKQQMDMLEYWLLCASRPSRMKIDYFKSFIYPECVWKKATTGSYLFFPSPNIPISVSSGAEARCSKQGKEGAAPCTGLATWSSKVCCHHLFSELHQTRTPQIFTALQSITRGFWASTQSCDVIMSYDDNTNITTYTYVYFSSVFFFLL